MYLSLRLSIAPPVEAVVAAKARSMMGEGLVNTINESLPELSYETHPYI